MSSVLHPLVQGRLTDTETTFVQDITADGGYENGTWTPALDFVTTGDLVLTDVSVNGRYIRAGKLMVLFFDAQSIMTFSGAASGNFIVTGIPFSMGGLIGDASGGIARFNNIGMTRIWADFFGVSATSFGLRSHGDDISSGGISSANIDTGDQVRLDGTLIYEAV